jgi:hypothetical protein
MADCRFSELTRSTFDKARIETKDFKAAGEDKIQGAVWNNSDIAADGLFLMCSEIWRRETFPPDMAVVLHCMIFKGKGSIHDHAGYRPIGLMNVATKILTLCILIHMRQDIENFLPDWQFGFRPGRGTGQAIAVWTWMKDVILGRGQKGLAVLIDFEDAFTSISHKYLFFAMQKAGIAPKLVRLTKALYSVAHGKVKTRGLDGENVMSPPYGIDNGAIQGNGPSPQEFLVGMHMMMLEIGMCPHPLQIGEAMVGPTGYADDLSNIHTGVQGGSQNSAEGAPEPERLSQNNFWGGSPMVRADTPGALRGVLGWIDTRVIPG